MGDETETALTLSVPEAGKRYYGLSRNGSYAAVGRGEIPVIRVGRLLRVPVRAMESRLDAAGRGIANSEIGGQGHGTARRRP
jgi:hypothetical protein